MAAFRFEDPLDCLTHASRHLDVIRDLLPTVSCDFARARIAKAVAAAEACISNGLDLLDEGQSLRLVGEGPEAA